MRPHNYAPSRLSVRVPGIRGAAHSRLRPLAPIWPPARAGTASTAGSTRTCASPLAARPTRRPPRRARPATPRTRRGEATTPAAPLPAPPRARTSAGCAGGARRRSDSRPSPRTWRPASHRRPRGGRGTGWPSRVRSPASRPSSRNPSAAASLASPAPSRRAPPRAAKTRTSRPSLRPSPSGPRPRMGRGRTRAAPSGSRASARAPRRPAPPTSRSASTPLSRKSRTGGSLRTRAAGPPPAGGRRRASRRRRTSRRPPLRRRRRPGRRPARGGTTRTACRCTSRCRPPR
mmetsp:Transcript_37886/g.124961  ORF Transcript_37886/g.124961 Transcript_37886/m.124961 type:complete len:289 (+) Transcript_37886:1899-2765(+)